MATNYIEKAIDAIQNKGPMGLNELMRAMNVGSKGRLSDALKDALEVGSLIKTPEGKYRLPSGDMTFAPIDRQDEIKLIQLGHIYPGPNVRSRESYSPQGLQELADSIRDKGLIQPLVVRLRDTEADGQANYETLIGGRRHYALEILLERGAKTPESWVPAFIRNVSDQEAFELGMVENIQREDMHPLDEAANIQRWLDSGADVATIAAKLAKSQRWVKQRLVLHHGLSDEAKAQQRSGAITLGQAQALTALPINLQARFLEVYANDPWDSDEVAAFEDVVDGQFLVKDALFDVERSGLEVVEPDLFDVYPAYFADKARALAVQLEAAQNAVRVEAERLGYGGYEVLTKPINHWDYEHESDPAKATLRLTINPDTGICGWLYGRGQKVVAAASESASNTKKAKAENDQNNSATPDRISKAGISLLKRAKVYALQQAVLREDNASNVTALLIVNLLGHSYTHLTFDEPFPPCDSLRLLSQKYAERLGLVHYTQADWIVRTKYFQGGLPLLIERVNALLPSEKFELLSLLTAATLRLVSQQTPDLPDEVGLAQFLGAKVEAEDVDEAVLKGFSREALAEIHKQLGGHNPSDNKSDLIEQVVELVRDYKGDIADVIPELRFATAAQSAEKELVEA